MNTNLTQDTSGWTALQFIASAQREGSDRLLDALLDAGADINYRDPTGATPLLLAASASNLPAVLKLLDKGADRTMPSGPKFDGLSFNEFVLQKGSKEIKEALAAFDAKHMLAGSTENHATPKP